MFYPVVGCRQCCAIFSSWKQLHDHQKLYDHHNRTWHAIKRREDMQRAKERERERALTEKKSFRCDHGGCNKTFSRYGLWNKHRKTHFKRYRCHFVEIGCTQSFATKSGRRFHERIHEKDKCEVCEFCCKVFTDPSALRKHIKYVHEKSEVKPFSCKHCKRRFARKESLQKHWKTHSKGDRKQFECGLCGSGYVTKSNLEKHKRLFHQ